ncbi:hypothetical protein [Pelotomaculum propionicicum]|uniref:Uncharacterized protein n=1 Tax=Pelotomaculum propionicicum TaxID=258475 RepID=A0A4Y7RXC0_9FIRM|nr:hypothetical protein [Pelotomaculum propionicicum]TEB13386.1 hypothetical protein Pmgp_00280 [Pelotomaculum propionicicum]
MTLALIYICGITLLLLLIAGLFAWQWRRLDAPVLPPPKHDEESWRQAMAKYIPSEPKPLATKPVSRKPERKEGLYLPVKMVARFSENKPKPAKGPKHRKKKNRRRQVQEEKVLTG